MFVCVCMCIQLQVLCLCSVCVSVRLCVSTQCCMNCIQRRMLTSLEPFFFNLFSFFNLMISGFFVFSFQLFFLLAPSGSLRVPGRRIRASHVYVSLLVSLSLFCFQLPFFLCLPLPSSLPISLRYSASQEDNASQKSLSVLCKRAQWENIYPVGFAGFPSPSLALQIFPCQSNLFFCPSRIR